MIVIGTRGSKLALWQANWVSSQIEARGEKTHIEIIRTTGDRITSVPLAQAGGKGLFTKEIEEALLDGSIDVAVHSLKDMPAELPDGLVLAAIPEREDARDAMVGATLASLKPSARIGTSSLRRTAQLKAMRPDLVIEPLRGNIDTRLRKLDEGLHDAILLASAGLRRLGCADRIAELIPVEVICPAAGQGALAIETRQGREEIVAAFDHRPTRDAVTAERAMLAALGGNCQVPIGAYARFVDGQLHLRGVWCSPDGSKVVRAERLGLPPEELGRAVAQEIQDSL